MIKIFISVCSVCCIVCAEFSLELSRTITSGTTIQRGITEEVVHLTSRVSIILIMKKNAAPIFFNYTLLLLLYIFYI